MESILAPIEVAQPPQKIVNSSRKIGFSPQLDSLRAMAVILTLLCHWLNDLWGIRVLALKYGVDIFFCISGFLITSILLKERKEIALGTSRNGVLKRFFIRRFLRLMPVYFVYLIGVYILGKIVGVSPWEGGTGIYYFAYLTNVLIFFHGLQWPMVNHFWSLAVEEQFYLLWPFLVLFLSPKRLKYLLVSFIVLGVAMNMISSSYYVSFLPVANFHTLGFGAFLAYLFESGSRWIDIIRKYRMQLLLVSLVLLLATLNMKSGLIIGIHQTSLFVFGGILTFATYIQWNGMMGALFNSAFLQWMGKISYGIYVFHKPVHYILGPHLIKFPLLNNGFILLIIYTIVTLAIATVSYKFLEMPFLALKKKFS